MAKKVSDLLEEVESILSKRASSPKETMTEKDIFSLADQLRKQASPSVAQVGSDEVVELDTPIQTLREKVAHALALTEVYANLPFFQRLTQFEKKACENGMTDQDITSFLEKKAFHKSYITLDKLIPWLGDR
jgi:hypothetical protein